jgi:acetyl/propionyl-CoA carboxylase alpha subunit
MHDAQQRAQDYSTGKRHNAGGTGKAVRARRNEVTIWHHCSSARDARQFSAVVCALLASAMLNACSDKNGAQAEAKKSVPTVPVLTGQVIEKSMPLRLHAIGNVETVASVAVKSRVDGQIVATHVRDGQDLVKGDALFQIDQKPYQSQLEQAGPTSPATRRNSNICAGKSSATWTC